MIHGSFYLPNAVKFKMYDLALEAGIDPMDNKALARIAVEAVAHFTCTPRSARTLFQAICRDLPSLEPYLRERIEAMTLATEG